MQCFLRRRDHVDPVAKDSRSSGFLADQKVTHCPGDIASQRPLPIGCWLARSRRRPSNGASAGGRRADLKGLEQTSGFSVARRWGRHTNYPLHWSSWCCIRVTASRHGTRSARHKQGHSRARLLHFSARLHQWWPSRLRPEPGGRNTTPAQRHPEQSETARAPAPRSPRLLQ